MRSLLMGGSETEVSHLKRCRQTERALAIRESSLVVEWVEGMRDGVRCKDRHLMSYNYHRREEALSECSTAW